MRVLAVLAVTAALASGAAAAAPRPHLQAASQQPLVVVGSHFRARERVTLVVHAARVLTFHARARHGSFTVRAGVVPAARCTVLRIVAAGSRGSHATLRLPRPECKPTAPPH